MSFYYEGNENSTYCAPPHSIHKKETSIFRFLFYVLFIYFACNPDETVWGLSVFCQGDRARSGENGVGVLSVSEGTLQSCQSRQRKGAQSFEALEHYWSSMQFSRPYFWTGLYRSSPIRFAFQSKAGVFYVLLWDLFVVCVRVWAWSYLSMGLCFSWTSKVKTGTVPPQQGTIIINICQMSLLLKRAGHCLHSDVLWSTCIVHHIMLF